MKSFEPARRTASQSARFRAFDEAAAAIVEMRLHNVGDPVGIASASSHRSLTNASRISDRSSTTAIGMSLREGANCRPIARDRAIKIKTRPPRLQSIFHRRRRLLVTLLQGTHGLAIAQLLAFSFCVSLRHRLSQHYSSCHAVARRCGFGGRDVCVGYLLRANPCERLARRRGRRVARGPFIGALRTSGVGVACRVPPACH